MKLLHRPERCLVLPDERARITAVRWRERVWAVRDTLDVWTYRGEWWTTPQLHGERRAYHQLATDRGEIEVFERDHPDASLAGWWVSRWWD